MPLPTVYLIRVFHLLQALQNLMITVAPVMSGDRVSNGTSLEESYISFNRLLFQYQFAVIYYQLKR